MCPPDVLVPVTNTYTGRTANMAPLANADGSVQFGPYRLDPIAAQQLGLEFYRQGVAAADALAGTVAQPALPLFDAGGAA